MQIPLDQLFAYDSSILKTNITFDIASVFDNDIGIKFPLYSYTLDENYSGSLIESDGTFEGLPLSGFLNVRDTIPNISFSSLQQLEMLDSANLTYKVFFNNTLNDAQIERPENDTISFSFDIFETLEPGAGNEIQLTDAMVTLSQDQKFYGHVFEGETYDCGSKAGFIQANLAFAMDDEEIADQIKADLRAML